MVQQLSTALDLGSLVPCCSEFQETMKYGAALVVMAIGEQGRAVTAKDKAAQLPLELYIWIQFGGKI